MLLGLVLIAAACGRSGFQYIENDDSTVFAKIPSEWEILSEGVVDYTLTGEDGQASLLPGDSTFLAWRVLFDEDPDTDNQITFDRVLGAIEVQPVDRRIRSDVNVLSVLGFDPDEPSDGVTVYRHAQVQQNELSGVRITYATTFEGEPATIARLILTDDRSTAIYDVRVFCDLDCFNDNVEVIDEIIDTFTVEVG